MKEFKKLNGLQVLRIAGKCMVFWEPSDKVEMWATARVANQILGFWHGTLKDEPILFSIEKNDRIWLATPSIFG